MPLATVDDAPMDVWLVMMVALLLVLAGAVRWSKREPVRGHVRLQPVRGRVRPPPTLHAAARRGDVDLLAQFPLHAP